MANKDTTNEVSWASLSAAEKDKLAPLLLEFLLKSRLSGGCNYRYKNFKNLSRRASRLRAHLRRGKFDHLVEGSGHRRLMYNSNEGEFNYIENQSFNEEYIRMMEWFVNPQ